MDRSFRAAWQTSERPPYFSVELNRSPAGGWIARVKGTIFLKLRTHFFQWNTSAISSSRDAQRTLGFPEKQERTGQVEFPFGTLDVKQASFRSPPPIHISADLCQRALRRFGYDITLEVTGPADKPLIQFSSVLRSVRSKSSSCSPLERFA